MGADSKLVMRATIIRKNQSGQDEYGQPIEQEETVAVNVPCYAWRDTGNSRRVRSMEDMELAVRTTYIMVRKEQTIEKDDEIDVYTRRGEKVFDKLIVSDPPVWRHGYTLAIARRYDG